MPTSTSAEKLKKGLTLFAVMPAMLAVILAWTSLDESVAQLRLDHAALRAAEDDYRALREASALNGEEAADYAAWVAALQRRVFEDCEAVMAAGSAYPGDLPCPPSAPAETRSADIEQQSELTPEEQVAALDARLMAGLGEYDDRLLREQERIRAAAPNANLDSGGQGGGMGGAGGAGNDGGADNDTGGQDQGEGAAEGNQGAGANGPRPIGGPVDSSESSGDRGNDSDQPADIPDGSNDDVVARQLREAAEKETDPELKAKLWEEYRRYKSGTH